MPIYEYRRLSDGHVFEVNQKISDPVLTHCPDTGEPVEKMISNTSFALKGGGWYSDGYSNTKKTTAETSPAKLPSSTSKTEAPSKATSGKESGGKASD